VSLAVTIAEPGRPRLTRSGTTSSSTGGVESRVTSTCAEAARPVASVAVTTSVVSPSARATPEAVKPKTPGVSGVTTALTGATPPVTTTDTALRSVTLPWTSIEASRVSAPGAGASIETAGGPRSTTTATVRVVSLPATSRATTANV
jgi:hypothetical protein